MNMEQTLTIIKPDAVERHLAGKIIARLEAEGFELLGMKMVYMSKQDAERFYAVHRERPFFNDLTTFMSSGPSIPIVMQRANAIDKLREVMGATNPANAAEGTIRKEFALDIEKNSIHGSDSPESAAIEIPFFFNGFEFRP
jgi:nucleoside-diphosphate kinase